MILQSVRKRALMTSSIHSLSCAKSNVVALNLTRPDFKRHAKDFRSTRMTSRSASWQTSRQSYEMKDQRKTKTQCWFASLPQSNSITTWRHSKKFSTMWSRRGDALCTRSASRWLATNVQSCIPETLSRDSRQTTCENPRAKTCFNHALVCLNLASCQVARPKTSQPLPFQQLL